MTEASPGLPPRPLSPHLSIWRWHVTMFTSIAHRASGTGLYAAALIAAGWAVALASGPEAYAAYMGLLGSTAGKIVMFLITAALFFHLANGIRHLIWDGPHAGFAPKVASAWSVFNFAFALVAAATIWSLATNLF